MNREDQQLSAAYLKNERFEYVISTLNEALFEKQDMLLENKGDIFPTIHILGAPRSGTTLASQLISSCLKVGYINNFIATFWKAPLYGIELSKKLLGLDYISSFKSDYGRTDSIKEPHEFGYFWNYHLKYQNLEQKESRHEEAIDWKTLSNVLNNMGYAFNRPVVFKSFLFGFHAKKAWEEMPKTCYIYVKRDYLENALSILKLRKELNNDINVWGSIKPKQYAILKNLSVHEQIAGQILCLENEYLSQLESIPERNKLLLNYSDICNNPNFFLNQVAAMITNHDKTFEGTVSSISPFHQQQQLPTTDDAKLFIEAKESIKTLFPGLLLLK